MNIAACSILPLLFLTLSLTGCEKPGPIELQEKGTSEVTEVEPVAVGFFDDADTTGLLASEREQYFAELVLAGIRYDTPTDSHTVALARGIFQDKGDSLIIRGKKVYRTLDVGEIFIDGLRLNKLQRRIKFILPILPPVDTSVGVYYHLQSRDGIGGQGFRYLDSHRYEWEVVNTAGTSRILTLSAPELLVTSPHPRNVVSQRSGLTVTWRGGEESVELLVHARETGGTLRPVLKLRLRNAERRVHLAPKILRLLPVDRYQQFVFSFISRSRSETTVAGYPDAVLVHSASIHNLLLTVQH